MKYYTFQAENTSKVSLFEGGRRLWREKEAPTEANIQRPRLIKEQVSPGIWVSAASDCIFKGLS